MWSAAILVGGRARRLDGRDKSALVVDGVPIIDRQVAILRGRARDILLVGSRGAVPASCTAVDDLTPGAGALGALVTALTAAPTDRVLVLAGDMPFVTAPFVEFLAAVAPDARAVVPVSGGRWHPLCAMYARASRLDLSAAFDAGERTVRAAVAALGPRLIGDDDLAPFDADGRLLANLNTPDDLARWGGRLD
jgi:molybdopterin-guanine dinucleotide biosynthesis protein A